ncbi:hypothetical protein ON010_g9934 [Phytophthora cinnamomi]|nr:hypothetical protein ON010_g9934 [Phytophthora cinnamomi]
MASATTFPQFIARQARIPVNELATIRTDGGDEFTNRDFRKLIATNGVRHQHTAPYRSSQNCVAEREIRTLTEMASAMLIDSRLPHYLWEDTLNHAAYIRNRIPTRQLRSTPHEHLFGKRLRFGGRGILGAFVGFSESVKGYRVYTLGDSRLIRPSADVMVLERTSYEEAVLPDDDAEPEEHGEDKASGIAKDETATPTQDDNQRAHRHEDSSTILDTTVLVKQ